MFLHQETSMKQWLLTIKNWLLLPAIEDENQAYKVLILYAILTSSIGVVILFFLLIFLSPQNAARYIIFTGASVLITLLIIGFARNVSIHLAGWLAIILYWLVVTAALVTSGGNSIPAYMGYLTLVALAGLLLGMRGGLVLVGLNISIITLITLPQVKATLPQIGFEVTRLAFLTSLIFQFIIVLALQAFVTKTIQNALNQARQEVAERRRVEAALRESEEKYRQLVSYSSDPIFSCNAQGQYLYVNEAFARRIEKIPAEIIGKTPYDLYAEADARQRLEVINQVFQTGQKQQAEVQLTTPTGEVRHYFTIVDPVKDKAGRVLSVTGISRDITEYKWAEEALRQNEAYLRSILDQFPFWVWLKDPEGRFLAVNQAVARAFGYDHVEELVGKTDFDLTPELAEKYRADDRLVMNSRTPKLVEELVIENNSPKWVETFKSPILDTQGRVIGTTGYIRDITERKQAEAALRESQAKYQELFELGLEAIFLIDNETGRLLEANTAATEIYGYSRAELLTLRNVDLSAEPDQTRQATISAPLNSALIVPLRYHRRQDGTVFPVEINARHFLWQGRSVHVAAIRDITERLRAEAEREQLITELKAKNTELEHFTYTVSHDLKSPLITINGFLGFLEKDALVGNSDRVTADVHRIKEAVEKMRRLLDHLLELSRVGRLMNPPKSVPFGAIVQEALESGQGRLVERGVEVIVAEDLPWVYGDRVQLVEVVQNLVDNAVKFIGQQPQPRIEIGVKSEGGEMIFYVRDNGRGIEPRYHQEIFGLFKRLDNSIEGTGIGLTLVKRIVEVHGGRIWVESAGEGQGATFYFTLNRVETTPNEV
jgi:PAS domain S-box-containing protein